jgi:hypothetical protein
MVEGMPLATTRTGTPEGVKLIKNETNNIPVSHKRTYAPAAFTPSRYPWYSFLIGAEATPRASVRPERIKPMKNLK